MNDIFQKLNEMLGGRVKTSFILAPYSTFKMGGPAQFYFEAESSEDLLNAYKAAHELNLKFTLLGGISNVVITEEGIKGLVVRNRNSSKEYIETNDEYVLLKVGSGYIMNRLVKETVEEGLEGIEYHLGLPGTIGGAVYMNSKWTHPKSYIGDVVYSAEVITSEGTIEEKQKEYFEFEYGRSKIQETKEIIVSVTLKLQKGNKEELSKRSQEALEYRKNTQPFGVSTSGCFFKNENGISAGKLIDEAGLKGFHIGDLYVSDIHANFIINKGHGNTHDLKELLAYIKKKVQEKDSITLKEEVVLL